MTQLNPLQIDVVPMGVEVATFDKYSEAQKAVDTLADSAFPVETISIIGTNLKMVEKVTGRMTLARAAMGGAISGAWFGLMIGLLWMLMLTEQTLLSLLVPILFGVIFGALFGLAAHAMTRGQRDFTSISRVVATQYGLQCTPEKAGECRRVLTEKGILRAPAPVREVDLTQPPQYGERIPASDEQSPAPSAQSETPAPRD